jgi:biotin-(acetyl-CoA carboxylase) ligase
MSDVEAAARLKSLLDRLEEARRRLERAEGSEAAVDVLQDLVQLGKEVQAEIERQKREGARE